MDPATESLPIFMGDAEQVLHVVKQCQKIQAKITDAKLQLQQCVQAPMGAWQLTLDDGVHIILGAKQPLAHLDLYLNFRKQLAEKLNKRVTRVDMRYRQGFAVAF